MRALMMKTNGQYIELFKMTDEEHDFLIKHFTEEAIRTIGIMIAGGMDKDTIFQNLKNKLEVKCND